MISVIIPVYNVEKYLRECIDSILCQTYNDFELLLIDDGSTDTSGQICDAYAKKDKRVRVFHKPNGGLSSARNYGIDNAYGDWIIFVDSDDLWSDNDCLTKLHEVSAHYNLDILRFEYKGVDEHLISLNLKKHNKADIQGKVLSNYEMVKFAIAGEWFAWLYFIKKDIIDNIRFDESVKFQEDIDFYSRLFATKELRCGYIDQDFYLYRKRESSITTTPKIENLRGSFNLCDVFYKQSLRIKDDKLKALYLYNSVMMYYWALGTLSESPYFETHKKIIKALSIAELHIKTKDRLKSARIEKKYLIFIKPHPYISVKLLHFKNLLVSILKR